MEFLADTGLFLALSIAGLIYAGTIWVAVDIDEESGDIVNYDELPFSDAQLEAITERPHVTFLGLAGFALISWWISVPEVAGIFLFLLGCGLFWVWLGVLAFYKLGPDFYESRLWAKGIYIRKTLGHLTYILIIGGGYMIPSDPATEDNVTSSPAISDDVPAFVDGGILNAGNMMDYCAMRKGESSFNHWFSSQHGFGIKDNLPMGRFLLEKATPVGPRHPLDTSRKTREQTLADIDGVFTVPADTEITFVERVRRPDGETFYYADTPYGKGWITAGTMFWYETPERDAGFNNVRSKARKIWMDKVKAEYPHWYADADMRIIANREAGNGLWKHYCN